MNNIRIHRMSEDSRKGYSKIERTIWDSNMSVDACAILCYLLSRPITWKVRTYHIAKQFSNLSERRTRSAFKELEQHGYMKIQGHGKSMRYDVHEKPIRFNNSSGIS